LTLEDGSYWLSRNVGEKLQTCSAQHPRTPKSSCCNFLFRSSKPEAVLPL
jgi:hypothetical protein